MIASRRATSYLCMYDAHATLTQPQSLCLSFCVLVIQVTIDPTDQNSSVFMSYPPRYCHVVDAAHDSVANEVVTAIVETEAANTSNFTCSFDSFFKAPCWSIFCRHSRCGQ